MVDKFEVVTLCGSSKFKKEFLEVEEYLSLHGCIVFSLGLFSHADNKDILITPTIKEILDRAHQAKIKISDSIFVINPGGYIGESTRKEIQYAESLGKKINYLEPIKYTYKGWVASLNDLIKYSKFGAEHQHGDVYMVQSARGIRDINKNLVHDMQFVAYDKNLKGWYCVNFMDAELIKAQDQKKQVNDI